MRLPTVLFFVVVTILCWGSYGPTLHEGQVAMEGSRWRPFICVGLAYFLIAVVVPWILLGIRPEVGKWTVSGAVWSVLAGTVGAFGALGIILAFQYGGTPVFIMPLVFGLAPVVNTIVTMLMNRTHREASIPFYIAVTLVALGAAGVLVFRPRVSHATPTAAHVESSEDSETAAETASETDENESTQLRKEMDQLKEQVEELQRRQDQPPATQSPTSSNPDPGPDDATKPTANESGATPVKDDQASDFADAASFRADVSTDNAVEKKAASKNRLIDAVWRVFVICRLPLAILVTAICWGAYGPTLHKGQAKMEGSRLRPFICVGLAYFLIAVIVPTMVLLGADDGARFTLAGTFWSLFAGAVGAIGALGIIMAFNFGGRPVFVMPLVFGGAPIINTVISMTRSYYQTGELGTISSLFLLSLLMVILGAVCVLIFAPRPAVKKTKEDRRGD